MHYYFISDLRSAELRVLHGVQPLLMKYQRPTVVTGGLLMRV